MLSPRLTRSGRPALGSALVAALLASLLVLLPATPAAANGQPGPTRISNDRIALGLHPAGFLGFFAPDDDDQSNSLGLRYLGVAPQAEGLAFGRRDGWGVAALATDTTGTDGYTQEEAHPLVRLEVLEFEADDSTARSRVAMPSAAGSILEVVHEFAPWGADGNRKNLYAVDVTITNTSEEVVTPAYRRVAAWRIVPPGGEKVVTIDGNLPPPLHETNFRPFGDNVPSPLTPLDGNHGPTFLQPDRGVRSLGPGGDSGSFGAAVEFRFQPLDPDQSLTFRMYYGAAANAEEAQQTIDLLGVNLHSTARAEGGGPAFLLAFNGDALFGPSGPKLPLRKRVDRPVAEPNETVRYTVVATNPTDEPITVTNVVDTLPEGFTYESGSSTHGDPVVDARDLTWPGPFEIPAYGTVSIAFDAKVGGGALPGSYRNQATATAHYAGGGGPLEVLPTGEVAEVRVRPVTVASDLEISGGGGAVWDDPGTDGEKVLAIPPGSHNFGILVSVDCPGLAVVPANVRLRGPDGVDVPMELDEDGRYRATIAVNTNGSLDVVVECDGDTLENRLGRVLLYDPSGDITDASTGQPVAGAKVTLYRVPGALPDLGTPPAVLQRDCRTVNTRSGGLGGDWSELPPGDPASGEMAVVLEPDGLFTPPVNPQYTNALGRYAWDVAEGCWFVTVEAEGYLPRVSPVVGVPPEVLDLDLALTPIGGGGGGGAGGGPATPGEPDEPDLLVPGVRSIEAACPAGTVPEHGFADVPAGSVHGRAIACARAWAVVLGVTDDRFVPAAPVTRAQVASFLARLIEAAGGTLPEASPDAFPDDDGSVHEADIDRLTAAGILLGRTDGTFGPGTPVSRGQVVALLVRVHALLSEAPLTASGSYFADIIGSTHEDAINQAAEAGLAAGTEAGAFRPLDPVRRDQMASFLARLLALLVEEGTASLPT